MAVIIAESVLNNFFDIQKNIINDKIEIIIFSKDARIVKLCKLSSELLKRARRNSE